MKYIYILLFSLFLLSCAKKEIKIPTLAVKGIQEIHNHSQVWMFFEVKNNDTVANVNRKNTISTTHLVYNIDKRFTLKNIMPSIKNLQDKHANSIHSKEGMFNYFSYSDTISKKLSFLKFDGIIYNTDSLLSKSYIKTNSDIYKKYNNKNLSGIDLFVFTLKDSDNLQDVLKKLVASSMTVHVVESNPSLDENTFISDNHIRYHHLDANSSVGDLTKEIR